MMSIALEMTSSHGLLLAGEAVAQIDALEEDLQLLEEQPHTQSDQQSKTQQNTHTVLVQS